MGLDITAGRNAKRVNDEDALRIRSNPAFPGRENEIEDGYYTLEDLISFKAGSYSGYNVWRDELAQLAGWESARAAWESEERGPFWELINFSDCEGVLGPQTCARLLDDFQAFDRKAAEVGGYFYDSYQNWHQAMTLGSDNGLVAFW